MKKYLILLITGLLCPVIFANTAGVTPNFVYEPETDDPTTEFAAYIIVSDSVNQAEKFVKTAQQNDREAFVYSFSEIPEPGFVLELVEGQPIDTDRIFLVQERDAEVSDIYAGSVTMFSTSDPQGKIRFILRNRIGQEPRTEIIMDTDAENLQYIPGMVVQQSEVQDLIGDTSTDLISLIALALPELTAQ